MARQGRNPHEVLDASAEHEEVTMTLVDPSTGDLLDSLTADDARALTDQIQVRLGVLAPLVVAAFKGRAWAALGYSSWPDYCDAEFTACRIRLHRNERQELVRSLSAAGMSQVSIASATGLDRKTIRGDLREEGGEIPHPKAEGPTATTVQVRHWSPRELSDLMKSRKAIDRPARAATVIAMSLGHTVVDESGRMGGITLDDLASLDPGLASQLYDETHAALKNLRRFEAVLRKAAGR